MASRYWVGGTGSWSDTAHWSATSGGAGGASAPGTSDDVYINASSGSFSSGGSAIAVQSLTLDTGATSDFTGSTVTTNRWNLRTPTSFTAPSSLIISGSLAHFYGGNATYPAVTVNSSILYGTYAGFTGNNSIGTLTLAGGITVDFQQSRTQTITTGLVFNGTSTNKTILRSTNAGTRFTLSKASGTVIAHYADIKDSAATGGATWRSYGGTNNGNNTGWTFTTAMTANFSGTPTSGYRPLNVTFTDTTTTPVGYAGTGTTYLWDFGDGNTSTTQHPVHSYTTLGTYTVKLTVTDSLGRDIKTQTSYVTTTIQSAVTGADADLVLDTDADPESELFRSAAAGLVMEAEARGVVRHDTGALEEKRYLAKVYDEEGAYLETWKDISEPTFSQEINQLGSTLEIELARNSDTLGQATGPLQTEAGTTITTESGYPIMAAVESRNQVGDGSSVQHNNRVDIYVFYGGVEPLYTEDGEEITTESGDAILAVLGAPNGLRIFTGFIADTNPRYGQTETTIVKLASYGYDLDQYPVTDALGKTTVAFNSQDPSTIATSLVDKFVADAAADTDAPQTYTTRDSTSISTTGTTVSYTFTSATYGDALKKVLELMPSNWYFRVGLGDNLVYFRERSSTARHTFYLGKHIRNFDYRSTIIDSTNDVLFVGGGDPALYRRYREAPAARTRRSLEIYSDNRVTLAASAEIISEGMIGERNKVQHRSTLEVLSKQYDIESINVGDMVGFRNFGNEIDELLLQVVARTYQPDYVTLQLESMPVTVNKRLEDIKRNLLMAENQNVPDIPS